MCSCVTPHGLPGSSIWTKFRCQLYQQSYQLGKSNRITNRDSSGTSIYCSKLLNLLLSLFFGLFRQRTRLRSGKASVLNAARGQLRGPYSQVEDRIDTSTLQATGYWPPPNFTEPKLCPGSMCGRDLSTRSLRNGPIVAQPLAFSLRPLRQPVFSLLQALLQLPLLFCQKCRFINQ